VNIQHLKLVTQTSKGERLRASLKEGWLMTSQTIWLFRVLTLSSQRVMLARDLSSRSSLLLPTADSVTTQRITLVLTLLLLCLVDSLAVFRESLFLKV